MSLNIMHSYDSTYYDLNNKQMKSSDSVKKNWEIISL